MAANVNVTPGTGDVVAAEDISSVKYQKVKLVDATASSTAATGVAANPLQVSLANHGANATAVKVDGSAVTQPVSGTVAVTNAGITSIDGKITACNTGAVVLAAGTAEVGKLAAGTALIGKVSIDQATANANEVVIKSGTVTAVTSITNAVAVTNAGITSIDGKIAACNTGAVVLAAGTAEIGKLAAGTAVIGTVGVSAPATIGSGTKAVTTAGSRVALATTTACKKVIICALDTNTGKIYYGGNAVSATSGAFIYAGGSVVLDIADLASVYIDAGVNGEGVNFTYVA